MKRIVLTAVLTFALAGCAVSNTWGGTRTGSGPIRGTWTTGASSHAFRSDAPTFGMRLHSKVEHGLEIRNAMAHAGYDVHLFNGTMVLEPGMDIGGGAPTGRSFPGTGAYAGPALNVRVLIYGIEDEPLTFNLATIAIDFLAVARVGAWLPPESSRSKAVVGEWGFEFGFRFALASDLATVPPGKVKEVQTVPERAKEGTP